MDNKPKVSIVILSWNTKDLLRNCLNSIKKYTNYPNYEVVVIDQASKDGSSEMVKREFQEAHLIRNRKNVGFAGGHNLGFKISKNNFIFMLDSDTVVTKNWLSYAVETALSDDKIACVGSKLVAPYELSENMENGKVSDVLTVCGAAMLVKKSVIDEIGYLDNKLFFPAYGEENDWCYRSINAGYRVVEDGRSIVAHLSGSSSKKLGPHAYYLIENHRLKAMLLNLRFIDLIKFVPGLGLIFLKSIVEGKLLLLLKAYIDILKGYKNLFREREKRLTSKIY